MRHATAPLQVGILLGIGFFLHAMIPNSNAWPMLWPAAAGVLGVLLARGSGRSSRFWGSIGVGLKAGGIAGLVFFVATAFSLWLLSSPGLTPLARQLGAEGPINLDGPAMLGLALAAVIGLGLAAISAGAAYPIAKFRR